MSKYDGLSKSQLVALLEKHDRTKKLGLVWERDEILADNAIDENFVAATLDVGLSDKPAPWRNLVIEGDNFDSLRWLRMTHAGQIKCIYIDPPYNTGKKDWVYNDSFVDKENRYRFSMWLEFLFRRLVLARDLLTEDGVILVSINDENRALLELMLEEALPGMRVGSLVWRTKDSSNDSDKNFSQVHEHVLVYGNKDFSFLGFELEDTKYKNLDNDPRGKYSSDPITKGHNYIEREGTYYPIQDIKTGWWYPCNPASVWRFASENKIDKKTKLRSDTIEEMIRDNRIIFSAKEYVQYNSLAEIHEAIDSKTGPVDGKKRQLLRKELPDLEFWVGKKIGLGRPSRKSFWNEKVDKIKPVSSYILKGKELENSGYYELHAEKQGAGSSEIQEIFNSKVFQNPKPTSLIRNLLRANLDRNDIALDFFAGSATTAQAVMELNAEDDGNRIFIMASSTEATEENADKNICRDITAERIRLLNKAEGEKYGSLSAEFAYLKTREIPFDAFDDELKPQEVWSALEALHGLPLTEFETGASWNEHAIDSQVIIYADDVNKSLITHIQKHVDARSNLFVYSWAPGQIEIEFPKRDFEVRSVRDTLIRRFQQ